MGITTPPAAVTLAALLKSISVHGDSRTARTSLRLSFKWQWAARVIREGRYARGEAGHARQMLMYLLRKNLPWTYARIADFLHLKNPMSVYNACHKVDAHKLLKIKALGVLKYIKMED